MADEYHSLLDELDAMTKRDNLDPKDEHQIRRLNVMLLRSLHVQMLMITNSIHKIETKTVSAGENQKRLDLHSERMDGSDQLVATLAGRISLLEQHNRDYPSLLWLFRFHPGKALVATLLLLAFIIWLGQLPPDQVQSFFNIFP